MRQIRYLILAVVSVLAFSLPLGGRPAHRRPKLVLPRFGFALPGECSDPSFRRICDDVKAFLPEFQMNVESGFPSDYELGFREEEFTEVESKLKDDWRRNDRSDKSTRPYIIEAKVVRAAEDGYYIVFHGRLVGETDWHTPQKFPPVNHCSLKDLGTKHPLQAQQALAKVCQELLEHWRKNNEE